MLLDAFDCIMGWDEVSRLTDPGFLLLMKQKMSSNQFLNKKIPCKGKIFKINKTIPRRKMGRGNGKVAQFGEGV